MNISLLKRLFTNAYLFFVGGVVFSQTETFESNKSTTKIDLYQTISLSDRASFVNNYVMLRDEEGIEKKN